MSIGLIGGGRQREKRRFQHRVHGGDAEGVEKRRTDLKDQRYKEEGRE
jgi:hypothetical protein